MNPDRATIGPSPLAYLNVIQRGSEHQWAELFARCQQDALVRAQVIEMLRFGDPYQRPTLQLWADMLGAELQLNSNGGI